ncbi:NAD-dependent epimerase/dehydratase family protein [Agromyces seonyuensis]|uniref:NAD-dependent epimerase/dehydratase family protein n=1 Tax=Agromyces seonyuensis TaxID=2662446 RepID=A0A6I4P4U5_9MICO|nr:NAD(P)-dependent oxidoreductase [Agromyces seonyuensis]MWB99379.1 NAD-dependent epimerase/dehydratase family protein [Agromyces seonyuensis]
MRILVTGSSGRLGRSLATELGAAGHHVFGADRSAAGLVGVDERELDLADAAATAALLADVRPDALVHLAAIAVPFSAPERTILAVNTTLAHTVFEAAREAGVGRVLAASSPTVLGYGIPRWTPAALPLDETHPVAPTNAYAVSKVVIEQLVAMYARTAPGAWGVFRPCYVISPEEWAGAPTQQGHTVCERLADPALAAVSLFNYLDARDAASFVDAWLAAPADAVDGEVFFVGAEDAFAARPVAELAGEFAPALGERTAALTGTKPVFSPAKAARMLGWRPTRNWRAELTAAGLAVCPANIAERAAADLAAAADAVPASDDTTGPAVPAAASSSAAAPDASRIPEHESSRS